MRTALALAFGLTVATTLCPIAVFSAAPVDGTPKVFAKVGDAAITADEFDRAFHMAVRRRFYHGKVPQEQMAQLQREVAQNMVDQSLLAREAKRRGIKPDAKHVTETVDSLEKQYKDRPQWAEQRATMLPELQRHLEKESVLTQLERTVRNVPTIADSEIEAYYRQHPDKFTEPERVRVSLILLKVDPSSPKAEWDKARSEATKLVSSLRAGRADFAATAKQRSGDPSSAAGGDMGYLHRGMLAPPAEETLARMKAKEISDPVTLLQGVAIFRLDDRTVSKLRPYAQVRDRARELLERERSDAAWNGLIAKLRRDTPVTMNEAHLLPLAAAAVPAANPKH